MLLAANVVIGLIALLHVYILVLEMFLWDTPKGHKAFNLTPKLAADTKVLAANQGLYNGFLAAGLFGGCIWAMRVTTSSSFSCSAFWWLVFMVRPRLAKRFCTFKPFPHWWAWRCCFWQSSNDKAIKKVA